MILKQARDAPLGAHAQIEFPCRCRVRTGYLLRSSWKKVLLWLYQLRDAVRCPDLVKSLRQAWRILRRVWRILRRDLEDFETSLEDFETSLEDFETSLEDFETSLEDFETSLEDFETSLEDFETSLEDFETSLEDFETSLEDFETSLEMAEGRLYPDLVQSLGALVKTWAAPNYLCRIQRRQP